MRERQKGEGGGRVMGNPWEHVYNERGQNKKNGGEINVCEAAMK